MKTAVNTLVRISFVMKYYRSEMLKTSLRRLYYKMSYSARRITVAIRNYKKNKTLTSLKMAVKESLRRKTEILEGHLIKKFA